MKSDILDPQMDKKSTCFFSHLFALNQFTSLGSSQ